LGFCFKSPFQILILVFWVDLGGFWPPFWEVFGEIFDVFSDRFFDHLFNGFYVNSGSISDAFFVFFRSSEGNKSENAKT
jgi:hypothetical protein